MTTVTYTAKVNLGNYDSETIEIEAEITNADLSIENVLECLREHVETCTLRPGWEKRARERATAEAAKPAKSPDPFAGFE